MKVSLRKLEIFDAVVRYGSISSAAKMLSLTQPAVSAAIASLEEEVGLVLYRRNNMVSELTPEAKHMSSEVRQVLASYKRLEKITGELQYGRTGKLNIGCMAGLSYSYLPELVARFYKSQPGSRVTLKTSDSHEIREWVRSGAFDLGVIETPSTPDPFLKAYDFRFDMICAVHKDSALAEKSTISVKDLDGVALIGLEEKHAFMRNLASQFRNEKCPMNIVCETHFFTSAASMVEEGVGAAVIDPFTALTHLKKKESNLVMKPMMGDLKFEISVVLPKYNKPSKTSLSFSNQLRAELEALERTSI